MKLNLFRPIILLPFSQQKHGLGKWLSLPQKQQLRQFSPHFVVSKTLSQFFIEVYLLGGTLDKSMTAIFLSKIGSLESVCL